jgi:hypothetical protein
MQKSKRASVIPLRFCDKLWRNYFYFVFIFVTL